MGTTAYLSDEDQQLADQLMEKVGAKNRSDIIHQSLRLLKQQLVKESLRKKFKEGHDEPEPYVEKMGLDDIPDDAE